MTPSAYAPYIGVDRHFMDWHNTNREMLSEWSYLVPRINLH